MPKNRTSTLRCLSSRHWFLQQILTVEIHPWCTQAPVLKAGACLAWSLQTEVSTMDHSEIILTNDDSEYVCCHLEAFLLHWQGLSQMYKASGICRWKIRPKHHYFEETTCQVRRTKLNPRHLACWVDEGYLGHIKKIGVHCHASNVMLRIFQRLMINLSHRFHKTRELAKQVELLGCTKKNPALVDSLPMWTRGPRPKMKLRT